MQRGEACRKGPASKERCGRDDTEILCTASSSANAEQPPHLDRRSSLIALASAAALCSQPAQASSSTEEDRHASDEAQTGAGGTLEHLTAPDYTAAGPLSSSAFPNLEHTCSRCFPACLGNRCMLRLGVIFPRDGRSKGVSTLCNLFSLALKLDPRSICRWLWILGGPGLIVLWDVAGMPPPYPLAIISGGFVTAASSYLSYARRLASWGYTVVLHDKGGRPPSPAPLSSDRLSIPVVDRRPDYVTAIP